MSDNQNAVTTIQPEVFSANLPVTRSMMDDLKEQRLLLREFVQSQLRKDVDFGIIPGTQKPSLYKPGAEKMRGLFGLNLVLDCTSKELDRVQNFAMFTYKAKVFRGEKLIAECEGSANSQEVKYRERSVWKDGAKSKEATPVCDILNTLQKMAQKRAFVGGIILAVGASDFFTQDIDDPQDARSIGTLPREEKGPSNIPAIKTVSSQPKENNQNKSVFVEAVVSYDDRELAKKAGFRFEKESKKWIKEITLDDFHKNSFGFEIREV